ncbi:GNAT family N-acetyltransferase [Neotabrizicola shimadae]|uniref:GNAT family N-acetyltransferase n=1 Tax=Neotabrizicola shimadae TaxID=2807096 RepID=A0A8G1EEH2_9RHOB|nr:GNAT family N-acetyltransferase [Neotabrizicola shimadae]QYZ70604.1 GNAT family N-acetyltransferase [Neotabrizicola shimadae]
MTRPTIRPARPEDLPALLSMVRALALHHGDTPEVTEADLKRDVFSSAPWLAVLVADGPQGLLGYAALMPLAQLQNGLRGMELHHLYVRDNERNLGTGSLLIEAAVAHARRQGCAWVTVGTAENNEAARAFYERRGFLVRPAIGPRLSRRLAA